MERMKLILLIICVVCVFGCEESETEGTLSVDIKYKDKKQTIVTGLGNALGEFLTSKSSLPIRFEIENVVSENGTNTETLFELVKAPIIIQALNGDETPTALKLKSDTVMMPSVSIEEFTGKLIVREGNNLLADKYHFDVRVTNVSGSLVLEDALILEVKDFDVLDFNNFITGVPVIERLGDTPHQILFTAFNENAEIIPAESIDFIGERDAGFRGIFVDDTADGELWNVNFPVKPASTYVYLNDEQRFINFALGKPGNYKITFYK